MKGDAKVIGYLNKVLYNELTAINQYFLHAKMLKNWGIGELSEREYKVSIVAMKRADALADRILFLEGLPNFQALGKLRIGESPSEVLRCDRAMEQDAITLLREAASHSETVGDYVSRDLLAGFLSAQEEQFDWLDTQLELIERVGEPNYLITQLGD